MHITTEYVPNSTFMYPLNEGIEIIFGTSSVMIILCHLLHRHLNHWLYVLEKIGNLGIYF